MRKDKERLDLIRYVPFDIVLVIVLLVWKKIREIEK